jgi:hypothetical protein
LWMILLLLDSHTPLLGDPYLDGPDLHDMLCFCKPMELIFEPQQRLLLDGTKILAHIRKRFVENSKMIRDNDPYVGPTKSSQ